MRNAFIWYLIPRIFRALLKCFLFITNILIRTISIFKSGQVRICSRKEVSRRRWLWARTTIGWISTTQPQLLKSPQFQSTNKTVNNWLQCMLCNTTLVSRSFYVCDVLYDNDECETRVSPENLSNAPDLDLPKK